MERKLIDDNWITGNENDWDTDDYDYPTVKWYLEKKSLSGTSSYNAFISSTLTVFDADKTYFDSLSSLPKTSIDRVIQKTFVKNKRRTLPYKNEDEFLCELACFISEIIKPIERLSSDFPKEILPITLDELEKTTTENTATNSATNNLLVKNSDTPQSKITSIDDGFLSSISDNTNTSSGSGSSTQSIKNIDVEKLKNYYRSLESYIDVYVSKGRYLFSRFE